MKPYTIDVLDRAWRELAWENADWNLSLPLATPDRLVGLFDEGPFAAAAQRSTSVAVTR